jgi:hypothetical protein
MGGVWIMTWVNPFFQLHHRRLREKYKWATIMRHEKRIQRALYFRCYGVSWTLCWQCDREYSNDERVCPHCGRTNANLNMNRALGEVSTMERGCFEYDHGDQVT